MNKVKQNYIRYTKQYLKAEVKEIEKALMKKLDQAENSGSIPEDWMKTGNHLLKMAIIDSFCQDRPYKMRDNSNQKEAQNIHLFI